MGRRMHLILIQIPPNRRHDLQVALVFNITNAIGISYACVLLLFFVYQSL